MIFACKRLIAFVASIMTIKPGDIPFTGTPQGLILGEKAPPDQRRWLQPGDEVLSGIQGLGQLRVQLIGPPKQVKPKANYEIPRERATIDRLAILTGGEAHATDISQWSPGVNEG